MAHVHESPKVILVPLFVLAIGAVFAGIVGYDWFVGHDMAAFWNGAILVLPEHTAMENAHHAPAWVKLAPLIVGIAGIAVAFLFYIRDPALPGRLAGRVSRSEEHTSELQSLMRISYAVFCLKK